MNPTTESPESPETAAERMMQVRKEIRTALNGLSKEQCCAILAAIVADYGLYDQAIDLLKMAKKRRDDAFKVDA